MGKVRTALEDAMMQYAGVPKEQATALADYFLEKIEIDERKT